MNKRILSVFICVLLIAAVICAVPAGAVPTERMQIQVAAGTTEAQAGDTIDFQIVLGPVSELGSMQMALDIPAGLTYVAGSGKVASGVQAAMGFDNITFEESSLILNGYASAADYASTGSTTLASFQCTVDASATGSLCVGLTDLEMGSCQTFEVFTDMFDVVCDSVVIGGETPTAAPTVAPTEAPTSSDTTTAPTVAPTSASSEKSTVAPTQKATNGKSSSDSSSKSSSATKDSTSPKTSDSGMIFVWIGLFALAILGVAGTFVFKKVRK